MTKRYVLVADDVVDDLTSSDASVPLSAKQGNVLNTALAGKQNTAVTASGTLLAAGWSSNAQTIAVTGVTASNTVIVSPAPASFADYGAAKIYCSAQADGTLTFTCTTVPTADITVSVVIL